MIAKWKSLSQMKRDVIFGCVTVLLISPISFSATNSVTEFLCRIVIYILFASAVNIILGFDGLRSLGQGIYLGFAAHAYLYIVVRMKMPLGAALPLSLVCMLALAAVMGVLCLRLNDDLASTFMNMGPNTLLWTMVQKLQIVGSDTGTAGAVRLPFALSTKANFYLCSAACTVCIILIYFFFKSSFATVLRGSRESIERLIFLGIDTRDVRLVAYMVSVPFCGIAGLCYSMRNMGALPTMISTNASLDTLIMCLIGGMYSFFGPILRAAIVMVINVQLPIYAQCYQVLGDVIIMLCVLFLQGGLLTDKVMKELNESKKNLKRKGEVV